MISPLEQRNRVALDNDKPRVDSADKATGRAKYTSDIYPPNMLWAKLIRSPYGKASINNSDLAAAKAIPGVVDVAITSQDANYHGQPVGYVVAETRQVISDALAAVKIDWKKGMAATRLGEEAPPADTAPSQNSEVAALLASPESKKVSAIYDTQVQMHCCMEPHGVLVDYRGDHALAYGSTQGTFGFRDAIAGELGLPPEKVEFHCEFVGGGFGSKFQLGEEGQLAARMSKKFNRPVRCYLDRKEEQLDGGMRPSSLQRMQAAVGSDGKITAARIQVLGGVGFAGGGGGASNPARYNFGKVDRKQGDVNLASQSPRAARAPGHPQGMFAVEMFMDELAAAAGIDPMQFRLTNDDNTVRREMYALGAKLIGWDRRKPDGAWPGVFKTGFGIGATDWFNRSGGQATVDVVIHRSGQVEVFNGAQDIGMGFRTLLADIVAHQIGIPRERVTAKCGVSTYPSGPASGGSQTSGTVAPKIFGAAEAAKQQLLAIVGKEWNQDPATLKCVDGVIRNGTKSMDWDKACKLLSQDSLKASVSEDGAFGFNPTASEGVQFVEAEVDTETGIVRIKRVIAIQHVGQPVNRSTIENQITGAVIQGMSFALFEERILNRVSGTCTNANMEMYKIAGSMDIPEITPIIWPAKENEPVNAVGEPPIVPTPGAIGCAVANAIGARVRSLPITPDKVLAAMAAKGSAQA